MRATKINAPPGWRTSKLRDADWPDSDFEAPQMFWRRDGGAIVTVIRCFEMGRLHVSMARDDRLPSWDEIKELRALFTPPDMHMMIPLPPERFWLNLHENCLHLHELRDPELAERFEREGMAARAAKAGLWIP